MVEWTCPKIEWNFRLFLIFPMHPVSMMPKCSYFPGAASTCIQYEARGGGWSREPPPGNNKLRWPKPQILRGRRKSSQKLAKRRTYVWGGGGLDRLRKASFKKKKKKKLSSTQTTGGALRRALMQIAWSQIKKSFWNRLGSFDTVILTLPIIYPSRLFLSSSVWFLIFQYSKVC